MASVGFHAVVFAGLALMPAGGQQESGDLRIVGLVNEPSSGQASGSNAPPPGLDFSNFEFPPIGNLPEMPEAPPLPPAQSFFTPPSVTTPPRQSFPTMPLPSRGSPAIPPSLPSRGAISSNPSPSVPRTPSPQDYEFGDPSTLPTLESPFALNPPQLPGGLGQPLPNESPSSESPSQQSPSDGLSSTLPGAGENQDYQSSVLLNDWVRNSRNVHDPQILPQEVELALEYPIAACADQLEGTAKVAALYDQNGRLATNETNLADAQQQYAFNVNRNPVFIQSSGQTILDDALLARVKTFQPEVTGYHQARVFRVDFQYNAETCQKAAAAGLTSGESQSPAAGESQSPAAEDSEGEEEPEGGAPETPETDASPEPSSSQTSDEASLSAPDNTSTDGQTSPSLEVTSPAVEATPPQETQDIQESAPKADLLDLLQNPPAESESAVEPAAETSEEEAP